VELDATMGLKPEILSGARKLTRVCARVEAGESVVIVTDRRTEPEISEALQAAALEAGARPVVCLMPARALDGQEPPGAIAAAMKVSRVFFLAVAVSITHTDSVRVAISHGARGLAMTGFTSEMLEQGGIEADFSREAPVCERLASVFDSAETVKVTTPRGTDLLMDATGRRGNAMTCMVEPGQFSPVPNIEANFSPVEGTSEGLIVADASIPYLGIGVLGEPVRAVVENGLVKGIEGGREASIFRGELEAIGDERAYNIAELGVGLNPKARICGLMLEDEGVLGVVHVGIGTNTTLGGRVKARTHYDLLMYGATVTVDGETVLEEGRLRL